MELRGFSLSSSTAGPNAQGPASALGAALRAAAEGGSPVMARVLSLTGGEAVLELLGHRVTAEAHTQLHVGDRLFVKVEQGADGTVRLAVQASGPADGRPPALADAQLDEMLREAGLHPDDRSRVVVRALVARDGRFDRAEALRLLAALKPFSQVGAGEAAAAALLQRAGHPLSPALIATLAARAHPEAPPALAERLSALLPGLQAAALGRGAVAAAARGLLGVLTGLPLGAPPAEVAQALGAWVERLTPDGAPGRFDAGKSGGEAFRGVPSSHPTTPDPGINYVNPASGRGRDLATALENAARALGASAPELRQKLSEAVAEVRYVQLMNGGSGPGQEAAWLVPLVLPGRAGDLEGGRLQVWREAHGSQAARPDEGTRVALSVPTDHLDTVQAELVLRDGTLDLSLGLHNADDRAFVDGHLDALREALAAMGFTPGRFGTRLATAPLPGLPLSEGLDEVVHFDRKV